MCFNIWSIKYRVEFAFRPQMIQSIRRTASANSHIYTAALCVCVSSAHWKLWCFCYCSLFSFCAPICKIKFLFDFLCAPTQHSTAHTHSLFMFIRPIACIIMIPANEVFCSQRYVRCPNVCEAREKFEFVWMSASENFKTNLQFKYLQMLVVCVHLRTSFIIAHYICIQKYMYAEMRMDAANMANESRWWNCLAKYALC